MLGLEYAIKVCQRAAARHSVYADENRHGFGFGPKGTEHKAAENACLVVAKLLQKKMRMLDVKHDEQCVERCDTCRWFLTKRCISEKGCERYSGWEPRRAHPAHQGAT
jgi:hypothetical protein